MKIGIYGGTFNPPHLGHVNTVRNVQDIMMLDKIYVVPAGYPYMKDQNQLASKQDRFEMCHLAFQSIEDNIIVSDVEMKCDKPSYTIDTIRAIRVDHPDDILYLIIGIDSFMDMYKWKDPQSILQESSIIVVSRNNLIEDKNLYSTTLSRYTELFENNNLNTEFFPSEQIIVNGEGLSSTVIRNAIANKDNYKQWLPENVYKYILENKLYGVL